MEEEVVIASDVNRRNGVGIEVYLADVLILEIFRDDAKRARTITNFKHHVSLEDMERYINIFKQEIPWDFLELN